MSRNIWVISDTHFGHENIIKYCNRPFANAKEMDEVLIENWNKVVKDEDIVYHLGDVYFAQGHTNLSKLKGRKRLILGNHDIGKDQRLFDTFQKIMVWRMFPEVGLLLTHVPVYSGNYEIASRAGMVNVHGHIHDKLIDDPKYYNVSVEHTNYAPVNIEDIIANVEKRKIKP